jgi:predicted nucleic acid-binding protein
MKLRVYLDTSVFSAYCDGREAGRQAETKEFWARAGDFEVSTSELAVEELDATPSPQARRTFKALRQDFKIISLTAEMRSLAHSYVEAGIFTPAMLSDALHVAAAVLSRQDVLLSWNFRHLVNRRRRAMVNEVNISRGLPTIEIVAPPEV